ncbi:MAG: MerR family transcriptional regulator [Bacteroidetes bacterium]|nr:MerR family transcriptional regulator [Bacteroidota bacterium]
MSLRETENPEGQLPEEQRKGKEFFRDKYFIKDIENITGIKSFTLRVWEQRYGLLKPKRTETNIRYYEEDDLKYMLNVAILCNNGIKIKTIAQMSREEVQKRTLEIHENHTQYEGQIQALVSTMMDFDEREFNKTLSVNVLKIGMEETMSRIIFPFMEHIGLLWLGGSIHPAHEHFITNLIRQRLYVSIDQLNLNPVPGARRYLLFVPSGEPHDLSLLFANYILRARGQSVIYLGTSTPLEDLNSIFSVHVPDFIFCSLTAANTNLPTQIFINAISKSWPDTKILLTGMQVIKRKDLHIPGNVLVLNNPGEFIAFIEQQTHKPV